MLWLLSCPVSELSHTVLWDTMFLFLLVAAGDPEADGQVGFRVEGLGLPGLRTWGGGGGGVLGNSPQSDVNVCAGCGDSKAGPATCTYQMVTSL